MTDAVFGVSKIVRRSVQARASVARAENFASETVIPENESDNIKLATTQTVWRYNVHQNMLATGQQDSLYVQFECDWGY